MFFLFFDNFVAHLAKINVWSPIFIRASKCLPWTILNMLTQYLYWYKVIIFNQLWYILASSYSTTFSSTLKIFPFHFAVEVRAWIYAIDSKFELYFYMKIYTLITFLHIYKWWHTSCVYSLIILYINSLRIDNLKLYIGVSLGC
jgi:hypothetical protein